MTPDISSEKWISGNCSGWFYGNKGGVPAGICEKCPIKPLCEFMTVENLRSSLMTKNKKVSNNE